jgi:phosphoribosylaminoimidazolecarboxamide formyltransferase/IMP cyclohydrolase
MNEIVPIRRALLSVSNKQRLVELARALADAQVQLLASGGTFREIASAGLPVLEISAYTGQPEMMGGRVKTLHPKIHGGILARRELAEDLQALETYDIEPIDLVVVNLYPFRETVAAPGCTLEDAIENIDIGGPALIRSAAKNHGHVAVLTSPAQYEQLLTQLREFSGTTNAFRRELAQAAFAHTAAYDTAIASYLEQKFECRGADDAAFPPSLDLRFNRKAELRYGENPHQRAAFYVEPAATGANLATARILHGKELSYNNLLDLDSALRLVRLFPKFAAVVLKHNNPCGAARAATAADAFEAAYEGDPVSAFGGIVGLNCPVDLAAAQRMGHPGRFLECVVAPGFERAAFDFLTTKPTWKNSVRLVELPASNTNLAATGFDMRRVEGGLLVQDWDSLQHDGSDWCVVTKRAPNEAERLDLEFAWRVCWSVKSNAIVIAHGQQLLGVGAGQMSRLDSVKIAVEKAGNRALGAVLASDAFFPFRDGPDVAAAAGVSAIIQPGGSKRDDETIAACDEHGIAMLFTGRRHFRH